jgi:metallo-beta-lactamase class B
LKKLGFDPARIKYAIVSHAHIDHIGGAKFLQDTYGTRIVMSAADWDFTENEKSPLLPAAIKPKRDVMVADGDKLTLGDTTLSIHLTPGHTPGTISLLIPVKDSGRPHLAATWGGTSFNFELTAANFQTYINSAAKYHEVVAKSGADVLLSNHTIFDGSRTKLPAMATRKAGDPHPYVIGNDSVQRYVKVAEECAWANLSRLK